MSAPTILTDDEIKKALADFPEWYMEEGLLKAEYAFKDFISAIGFIDIVSPEIEAMQHHPNISISYNKVSFSMNTHDAGYEITDLDTKTAILISIAAKKFL